MKKVILFVFLLSNFLSLKAQYFEPVWETPFNPMNIYISAAELNDLPLAAGSEIGVFDFNQSGIEFCVGSITLNEPILPGDFEIIVCSMDDGTNPGNPNGFIQGNPFIFRYYASDYLEEVDDVTQYFSYPGYDETFTPLGSAFVELSAEYTPAESQTINLPQGWSGISSYISPDQLAVDMLFQPIINELIILHGTNGFFYPGENINTLIDWEPYTGYKIKVNSETTFAITGNILSNRTISLEAGWNLIPVLSECDVPVEGLFLEADVIFAKEVSGTAVFWPAFGINTLQLLVPGKAYFVLMDSDSQITFPVCTDENSDLEFNHPTLKQVNSVPGAWADIQKTANSHIIALPKIITEQFVQGDLIGVFSNKGQIYGASLIEEPGKSNAVTVYGDDPTTFEIDGFVEDQQMNLRLFQPSTGIENSLSIVYNKNLPNAGYFVDNGLSAIANIELTGVEDMTMKSLQVEIHPNPSSGVFNITLNEVSPADFEVYDIHGVCLLDVENQSGGFNIDLSGYAKGIYYLKIEQGGLQDIRKLVLQ